jgi:hypothetical protein
MGSEEFAEYFAGKNMFYSHLFQFTGYLVIILFSIVSNERRRLIFLASLLFFMLFVYQVKSWLFMTVVAALIYQHLTNQITLSAKKIFLAAVFLVSVFCLIYFLQLQVLRSKDLEVSFYFKHLSSYLSSGFIGLSEFINDESTTGTSPEIIFAPLVNSWSFLNDNTFVNAVNPVYFYIDAERHLTSNVHSFFGSLVVYLGYEKGILWTIILSACLYALLLLTIYSRNQILLLYYCIVISILLLGWLNYYYFHLVFWEYAGYSLIFFLIGKLNMRRIKSRAH